MYITGSQKAQQKMWEAATRVIKYANKNNIGKKELVKLLLEVGVKEGLRRLILLTLLIISVIGNILQFIF